MKNFKSLFFIPLLALVVLFVSGCAKSENTTDVDNTTWSVTTWEVETWVISDDVSDTESQIVDGTYQLDTESSVLNRIWSRVLYSYHGKVFFKQWTLKVQDGNPIWWEFVLDMTNFTLEEGKEAPRKHLMSADFFDVETYPESKLVITNIEKLADYQYNITADLTIKDATHPITFVANFDNNLKSATGAFEIDRTVWDIRFGSSNFFDNLGNMAIKNEIQFDVDVVFN